MAALKEKTDFVIKPVSPTNGINVGVIRFIETVDATNTATVSLASLGIGPTGIIGIIGFVETTSKSVYAQELDTTTVASGVLTITFASGTNDDRRFVIVYGHSKNAVNP